MKVKSIDKVKAVGVRELHKELKYVVAMVSLGEEFIILKNNKPVFKISPLDKRLEVKKKYSLSDLHNLQFNSGQKNLSTKIDEIVYD